MATVRRNFVEEDTPSIIDTEYRNCHFGHSQPVDSGGGVYVGVRLFPGNDTPRTFIECNLGNCEVPPGSTVTNCNTWIRQSNVVSGTSTVTIDGVDEVLTHHKHIAHGKWTASGYDYLPAAIEIEVD